jgi:hypothetical protein
MGSLIATEMGTATGIAMETVTVTATEMGMEFGTLLL